MYGLRLDLPLVAGQQGLVQQPQELLHLVVVWRAGRELSLELVHVSEHCTNLLHQLGNLYHMVVHVEPHGAALVQRLEKQP